MKPHPFHLRVAACLGFTAVALGAFSAHALRGRWESTLPAAEALHRLEIWRTAELYHLTHAIALLALVLAGASTSRPWAWRCWLAGIGFFSGSLYLLGLTGLKWFGAITPVGGILLLAGWLLLAWHPRVSES